MHKQFDYVIVGGGSAGCALAARLSADPATSVLLLEAGPRDTHPLHHVPAGYFALGRRYTWGYHSTPQVHACDRSVELPQGRMMGGSSSVNAMVMVRGVPRDYDDWARVHGCAGWSYRDVLPYFIRSESNDTFSNEFHGNDGPVGVSRVMPHSLTQSFVRAAQQSGIPYNADFNGAQLAGCGFYQTSIRDGRRSSTSVAYLRPALGRPNLTARSDINVLRIVIERGRAIGVQITEAGRLTTIHAEREVIVTAGAVGSPKLLLLSGIGPAADLQRLGIQPTLDLPGVGCSLQDHARVDLHYELNGHYSLDRYKKPFALALLGLEYLLFRRGVIASNSLDGGGFWWSERQGPDPNMQFFFVPLSAGVPYRHGCSMNFYELRPRSRGSVRLRSSDPLAPPLIDPNYLAEQADLEHTVAGLEVCRDIMRQPAMAKLISREYAPAPELRSREELAQYARRMVDTGYHLVGSCRMGIDDSAVVTPDLRVRGISGLRVCDSSVMPAIVSGNTNAAVIMIGEKAADLIIGRTAAPSLEAAGPQSDQPAPGREQPEIVTLSTFTAR
ncbi:MAG: GMC family oxidoreductase N-terminal domain-containing protein [Steroidobacteraceae bacterium]